MTLISEYEKNINISPDLRKLMFSLAKVENVVKPPQKPTVAKSKMLDSLTD